MKKHFTGIALFIFIVGISAFVASMFIEIPKTEVFEIRETVPQYTSKKKCSKKYRDKEQPEVKLLQTVYNEKTKRFFIEFSIENHSFSDSTEIKLHFFIKDAGQVRFVSTEKVLPFNSSQRRYFLFDSLGKLESHKNLYVIAELQTSKEHGGMKNVPDFDENKATSVLVVKN